jgi:hypothetical protein
VGAGASEETIMILRATLLSRCLLSAALGLAALGGTLHSADAQARVRVGINVHVAPPPLRHERVVVRPGHVWTPGYWRWGGRQYVWVNGYSVRARPGYVYRPARWEANGPQWRFHSGYWSHR